RLLILGIGIGAIAGTVLSTWQPQTKTPNIAKNNQNTSLFNSKPLQSNMNGSNTPVIYENKSILKPTKKIDELKKPMEDLVKKNPKLKPGLFLIDLDTGAYFDYSGNASFSAASMIKVPILLAFFQDVDAGKIKLNEELTLEKSIIAEGAGTIQYDKIGSKFTTLEVATKMMQISDNTATNMIIKRLGGQEKLNQRFKSWGLKTTVINNLLADLEGTNLTTPKELVTVMGMINQGEKISSESRDRILDIMQKVKTNTLLPKGLEKNATIAHKTGDIRSVVGDVGLIDMPTGKRYMVCVIVKRSNNDPKAQELIRQLSKTIYQHFKNN
ncbi:MAG TPA: serine hydrolase, partial [Allocoleopsis sp.]